MAITANKIPGVRAAVAWSEETARLARQHNDANVWQSARAPRRPSKSPPLLRHGLVQILKAAVTPTG